MIEVRIGGRGVARGDETRFDPAQQATCSLCGGNSEAVASLGSSGDLFSCAACLRARLDALSIGRWQLRDGAAPGLPWGKVAG